jgi:hypothetical protein
VLRESRGQAAVELLAVVPALLVAGLVAWQLVLVGHAAWGAAHAARAAARADVVGEDAVRAARSALPASLARGLDVERSADGITRARIAVPLARRLARRPPVAVAASTSLRAAP